MTETAMDFLKTQIQEIGLAHGPVYELTQAAVELAISEFTLRQLRSKTWVITVPHDVHRELPDQKTSGLPLFHDPSPE